jgi:hypothetical protein
VDFDAWVKLPVKLEHGTKIWKKESGNPQSFRDGVIVLAHRFGI